MTTAGVDRMVAAWRGMATVCNLSYRTEMVDGVPGAFVLKSVLSLNECADLQDAVRLLHDEKAAVLHDEKKPRRPSQHHIPTQMDPFVLAEIMRRLHPHMPTHAGPSNRAPLATDTPFLSPFLRSYYYHESDFSMPHYDKSFTHHEGVRGRILNFSAYSILFYLNDGFEGGHTTFFTDKSTATIAARVAPCAGDVLVFPHGSFPGCFPNPFHEGSTVTCGEKLLIRTDLVFSTMNQRPKLVPSDMTAAQSNPARLSQLVQEGRVKSLGPGLDECRCGDLEGLQTQVAAGWNCHTSRDRHGSSGLLWAAGGGHLAIVQYLIESLGMRPVDDVQAHRRGYDGRSALHWAARNGHNDVVEYLVVHGGQSANTPAGDGTTPFHLAVWQNHQSTCALLVQLGADPHAVNRHGCNACMWASQSSAGNITMLEYLCGLQLDFERINSNGQGCLHKAAQRCNWDVCRWLCQRLTAPAHFEPNKEELNVPSRLAAISGDDKLAAFLRAEEVAFWQRQSLAA
ncbi:hypothetical protein H310_14653 [Aphanomyces invadans]|uniref:Fe2OG dioxygenase domain-containing protein n=1 Tax=Aphanomyces invadans TaxID=157072 RepID=A0A024T8V0_9STRA|nr:hypothetical protein H310_14653 [Aphanomyces invadans]ETV90585.1 hypothetical protein H310_14653 [Aphanomyces invadans]|eukprot:XP_008880771.1 hypothetical protein H310_14653 [Aphanomyces invadans]